MSISGNFNWKNIILLMISQAIFMIGTGTIIATSPIIGKSLANNASLATLPISFQYLATMLVLIPVAVLIRKYGYANAFATGALLGAIGMALSALSIIINSFTLFTACKTFIGGHNAVSQYYRFAAAESVSPAHKTTAISLTLLGGIIAAFCGPSLAQATAQLTQQPFTATFILLTGLTLITAFIIRYLQIPQQPDQSSTAAKRPYSIIIKQPAFLIAVTCSAVGYGVMNYLMVMAPLVLDAQRCSFAVAANVLQWHLVAMFLPSLFTGWLSKVFGLSTLTMTGAILLILSILTNLQMPGLHYFTGSYILLGVGWNFLYVGGSALLTTTYRPAERESIQAIHDTIVYVVIALSSLLAGTTFYKYGWRTINWTVLPLPFIALFATLWYTLYQHRKK
ncbi:MFS transporter [Chitinophaga pendula]|uniref:MFS transporter n=1 Tax=Chitinophaga pendula TaxID=2849666 RepID=UPI001CEC774C|nr:MFS transporter [Chitinophaga pendula]UCJ05155.1 MFS transporter [Chitinophaga pendula]